MKVEMSKSRVKQQNVSVIGLFSLAGRYEKMDDVPFPYVLSTCSFVCFANAFPIRSV